MFNIVDPCAVVNSCTVRCPSCGSLEAFLHRDPGADFAEVVCPDCISGEPAAAPDLSAPTEEVTQTLLTLTEILPATKSSPHNALRFTPETGLLAVDTKRTTSRYRVYEFPEQDGGRAFRFQVLDGGTDPEARSYDVFCGVSHASCECKGYLRHNRCKHIDAAQALIANNWSPTPAPVLMADTTPVPAPKPEPRLIRMDVLRFRELRARKDATGIHALVQRIASAQGLELADVLDHLNRAYIDPADDTSDRHAVVRGRRPA